MTRLGEAATYDTIEISDLPKNLDESDSLDVVVKDELAAGNTAVDVVRRSAEK